MRQHPLRGKRRSHRDRAIGRRSERMDSHLLSGAWYSSQTPRNHVAARYNGNRPQNRPPYCCQLVGRLPISDREPANPRSPPQDRGARSLHSAHEIQRDDKSLVQWHRMQRLLCAAAPSTPVLTRKVPVRRSSKRRFGAAHRWRSKPRQPIDGIKVHAAATIQTD